VASQPIGGGWPPRLARGWFGHPQASHLGAAEPPLVAQGVVRLPLGSNENLSVWPKGWPNHHLATPRPVSLGLATTYGVVWPPQHIFIYFFGFLSFFFFWIFFLKKCGRGILGIKRSNRLNCHNLKVWRVKCHT
jgi:hypothetical protein